MGESQNTTLIGLLTERMKNGRFEHLVGDGVFSGDQKTWHQVLIAPPDSDEYWVLIFNSWLNVDFDSNRFHLILTYAEPQSRAFVCEMKIGSNGRIGVGNNGSGSGTDRMKGL